ncbi:MAG TPA: GspH/FimT family pseudopilin [Burkholderiaceae bacterium]|nr:GspH/FimT family pseudopilin [Burkholderiaceae bacterium]
MDRHQGFTLIELLVTLSVLAILLAIGASNFGPFITSNRLTAQANELTAALTAARTEAIRLNATVVFCRSDDQTNCTTTSDDACSATSTTGCWGGWMAFVDANKDGTRQTSETIVRADAITPSSLRVFGSNALDTLSNKIIFASNGLAVDSTGALLTAVLTVCAPTTSTPENGRDIFIGAGGRAGVYKYNGNGACSETLDTAPRGKSGT